ncbi:MAG: glycosyltransferase family 39 protein [Myxococcota bacterium]
MKSHGVLGLRLRVAWPALLATLLALMGAWLRLAQPERAAPWYDEFRTLLHASGHTQEDLDGLLESSAPVAGDAIQARYFRPKHASAGEDLAAAFRSDLQVSPLYYALVRLTLGSKLPPLTGARNVAALLSVAALPAFFWLCFELFLSWRIAWFGLALASASPSLLYWAFEARPYSLWTFTLLASTAALLHAVRTRRLRAWALYALLTALMLWAHLFSVVILALHVAHVAIHSRQAAKHFAASATLALAVAAPWLVSCALFWSERVAPQVSWLGRSRMPQYFDHLSYALGHGVWLSLDGIANVSSPLRMLAAYALVGIALFALLRKAPPGARLLVLGLLCAVLVPLAVMDAALGGMRLSNVRYLLPSTCAIVVAVAWYLGSHSGWPQHILLFSLLGTGAFASVRSAQARLPEGKWRTEPVTLPSMSAALANVPKPLVVSLGEVAIPAALSLVADPQVTFAFFRSRSEFEGARALLTEHQVFLLDSSSLPWYYEPHQRDARRQFAALAPYLRRRRVAPGLDWVEPRSLEALLRSEELR